MRGTKYQTIEDRRVRDAEIVHPVAGASAFSLVFFRWANPLMDRSQETPLEAPDLWPLARDNQCKHVSAKFEAKFRQTKSFVTTFLSIFGWRFLFIGVLQFLTVAATLYGPYVLYLVVGAIETKANESAPYLCALVFSLFVVKAAQAFLSTHTAFQNEAIVLRFTSAVQQLVFQKALLLDAKAQKEKTPSDVTNLFTSDIMWIISAAYYTHQAWIIPTQLGAILYFLYHLLGYASLIGAVIIILTLGLNNVLVSWQRRIWKRFMHFKAVRARAVLAYFAPPPPPMPRTPKTIESDSEKEASVKDDTATEHSSSSKDILKDDEGSAAAVEAARSAELSQLGRAFSVAAGVTALLYSAPVLVTTASLAFYTLVQHESVTAAKVFTALALFRSLRGPLIGLPQIVGNIMQAIIAHRRLMAFMGMSEKNPKAVTSPNDLSASQYRNFASNQIDIAIEHGSFGWDADKPVFASLNLSVKRGETIVLHGAVGQGKSSLCSALLGELDLYEGFVFVGGRVAYCPQTPWLVHASIQDNILFGKPFDHKRYSMVLDACHLRDDIRPLRLGDKTVATTHGLSPSFQAKIALARACYNDADIYLLDMNAYMDVQLFQSVVLGLLRYKTVVLVSLHPDIVRSKSINRALELVDRDLVTTLENPHLAKVAAMALPALPARKGFWDEHHAALEADTSSLTSGFEAPDTLMSPSLRSPYGFLSEEHSYTMDENAHPTLLSSNKETPRIGTATYLAYLSAAGWLLVLFLLVVQALWQSLQVASDLWLGHWCSLQPLINANSFLDPSSHNATTRNETTIVFPGHDMDVPLARQSATAFATYHMQVYAILAGASVLMVVFRTLATSCAGLRASRGLFHGLKTATLVPSAMPPVSSELLSVYNSDMVTLDTKLPFAAGAFLANVFIAAFALGTSMWFLKSSALPMGLVLYGYYYVSAYYVKPLQDIDRLSRTTRGPHLHFVTEAITGAVVVRAFGPKQTRRFHRLHMTHVNAHQEASYVHETLLQWFSLRMQLLHALLMLMMLVALVSLRHALSPGIIGLIFNYALLVPPHVEFIVNVWSSLAAAMGSVAHVLTATDPTARV
ncbi:hypothetical protein SDRG_02464 [Saprolegnia diclina VS20]|uniref:ABC transmembrane type-1 domain-containing protein n=1 Tax=Saprolegnia diclina (strain VS20) TaxID=1156394 RepID=T0R0V5_SAPDV|nr:hypothetical protein SDRG_02464 [Saprolegnia diclina VS20]EQC40576.1 hypothetical protein SDRG_02464 [Saprolegnia diclina VS20]|eukprot:XP_008606275.1 hypothetical protein SDRG_02464 [Saprolegnia diclina VS20]